MIAAAACAVVVADRSKFGAVTPGRIRGFEAVRYLVTESAPDKALRRELTARGPELVLAYEGSRIHHAQSSPGSGLTGVTTAASSASCKVAKILASPTIGGHAVPVHVGAQIAVHASE